MLRRPFTLYLDARLFEWPFAAAMIALGLAMMVWPAMIHGSILQVLAVLGAYAVAAVFLVTGIATMAALIANGHSMEIGPRIRSVCAFIRAMLWASFTISMAKVSIEQAFPSPMIFFWPFFTVTEIYIVYRAVLDVRSS